MHDAAAPSQPVQQTPTRPQLQPVVQSAPSTTGIGGGSQADAGPSSGPGTSGVRARAPGIAPRPAFFADTWLISTSEVIRSAAC